MNRRHEVWFAATGATIGVLAGAALVKLLPAVAVLSVFRIGCLAVGFVIGAAGGWVLGVFTDALDGHID